MPRFGWLGESEPYPERQFPELRILKDGAPAKIEDTFAAFIGTSNITGAITQAGLDPFAIAQTPPFVTPKAGAAQAVATLERLGAIEKSGADYIAKWTVTRKLTVALSAGMSTLTLIYKARPAYGLHRFDRIEQPAYLAPYCLSPQDLVAALGRVPASQMFAVQEYAIPLSIDNKPPLSVSIEIDAPDKNVSATYAFCGADGKPVIGKSGSTSNAKGNANAIAKSNARTDPKGTTRILSIETPSK